MLWPWSGHLALYLRVLPEGEQFTGQATGEVTFSIVSPGLRGETEARRSHVRLPLRLDILPTPPRCCLLLAADLRTDSRSRTGSVLR